jgi:hypothetical protein
MTKAYPSIGRNDLILLQEIASYMLLGCGAVYVISVRENFGCSYVLKDYNCINNSEIFGHNTVKWLNIKALRTLMPL